MVVKEEATERKTWEREETYIGGGERQTSFSNQDTVNKDKQLINN